MSNQIQPIAIDRLIAHPGNPNRMSGANFKKLIRNIERTGRYEPLVVRPAPDKKGFFQIINGHHRRRALHELGYESVDAVVWDVDDQTTDILLTTLNRLSGSDIFQKKLALLKRLNSKMEPAKLAKLLPQSATQIERLVNLKRPKAPAPAVGCCLNPLVFFVSDAQQRLITEALSSAGVQAATKASAKAKALTKIAQCFLDVSEQPVSLKKENDEITLDNTQIMINNTGSGG